MRNKIELGPEGLEGKIAGKLEREPLVKPVTAIATYRRVNGYGIGLYEGRERDLLILGEDIPWVGSDAVNIVPSEVAGTVFAGIEKELETAARGIDTLFVYLGAQGAEPAFAYIDKLLRTEKTPNIALVACDCDYQDKLRIAKENSLPIIWGECGGYRTLSRIADRVMKGEGYDKIMKELVR